MWVKLEYDFLVRRLIPASIAVFLGLILAGSLGSIAEAQTHGTQPSGTALGFGAFGHPPGITSNVPSFGSTSVSSFPTGFKSHNSVTCCFKGSVPAKPNGQGFQLHHHHRGEGFPVGGVIYAVPYDPAYAIDSSAVDDSAEQPDYPSGPTVLDRRSPEISSQAAEAAYAEHMREESQPAPDAAHPAEAAPETDQPHTVLVFKDGHQLEVQNYAIVGSAVYDLTPGHRSRIPIADLDLAATSKQNDDRGVDFQLPAAASE